MTQNETKTNLSDEQMRMANILADPNEQGTIQDKCDRANVSRSSFYRWMKNKDFVEYLNSIIDQYTDAELSDVWKALINNAKKGDNASIKLYFELKGKYKETKEVQHSGMINFISNTPDLESEEEWNKS